MPHALAPELAAELRAALDAALAGGLRDDPLAHAGQIAAVAAALWRAFQSVGLECVLVGGSAIEVHAPGLHVTGDVEVVLDGFGRTGVRDTADAVLTAPGCTRAGRHWTRGDLFVELPSVTLDDPTELVRVGALRFRVVRKEVLLRDRVVGFLHWRQRAGAAARRAAGPPGRSGILSVPCILRSWSERPRRPQSPRSPTTCPTCRSAGASGWRACAARRPGPTSRA